MNEYEYNHPIIRYMVTYLVSYRRRMMQQYVR
jgi:hypothetical protein